MKFFDKQKIDTAGLLGVKIQKLIIFLLFANTLEFLRTGLFNLMFTVLTGLVLMIGFSGAYRRHQGMLRFFYVANLALITFVLVGSILSVLFGAPGPHHQPHPSENPSNIPFYDTVPMPSEELSPSAAATTPSITQTLRSVMISPPSFGPSQSAQQPSVPINGDEGKTEEINSTAIIVALTVYAVFCAIEFAAFVVKLVAGLLALRMYALLRLQQGSNLAHPRSVSPKPSPSSSTTAKPTEPAVNYIPLHAEYEAQPQVMVAMPDPNNPSQYVYYPMDMQQHQMMMQQQQFAYNPYFVPQQQQNQ